MRHRKLQSYGQQVSPYTDNCQEKTDCMMGPSAILAKKLLQEHTYNVSSSMYRWVFSDIIVTHVPVRNHSELHCFTKLDLGQIIPVVLCKGLG